MRTGPATRLPLPAPARRAAGRAAAVPLRVVVFGAFPDAVRRLWRVPWSLLGEQASRASLLGARLVGTLVPDRLRMVPAAYRALRDRWSHRRARGHAGARAFGWPRMQP